MMTRNLKIAAILLVVFLGVLAFAALQTDKSISASVSVSAPHIEINNAWMSAIRNRNIEALNAMTCHPSEQNAKAIEREILSINDMINQTAIMRLSEVEKERQDTRTIKIATTFQLRSEVNGQTDYTALLLVNSSTHHYCVMGFVLDKAVWPRRQTQAQE
jgi:hypothetical protein